LGISPVLSCDHPLPARFDFLPGFDAATTDPKGTFDLVVSLDCSDRERMGEIGARQELVDVPLINIDHHVTNLNFGTVNMVDAKAVSTTQVLYDLIKYLQVEVDERIASCLLTGLVTDTRGFRTHNVGPQTLQLAVDLLEAGAELSLITQNGLDRRPLATLRLWGEAFSRLQAANGIVWTSLPFQVQQAVGYNSFGAAGLVSMVVSAEEAEIGVVFTEREDGQVEVGFRAIPGLNVAQVALDLGGGGHPTASGCVIPGPLKEAEQRVMALLRSDLARQRGQTSDSNGRHPESE
jgi:phosphoesterase RecJ-like protein